ncbi:hypothetical protein ACH5RR_030063 [Cinchona calisaya]|uniref:Cytochrome c oxidase subunit 3 n=1 Tax=Cinchona calisaya TaxID=153742 RepID=A0ABD2YXT8_9GENT
MAYFRFTRSFDNNRRRCDASSDSSLAPMVEIGGIWPPKEIEVLDSWKISFLNTLSPSLSGAAITWAHHAILARKEKRAVYTLVATILLALTWFGYSHLSLSIGGEVYEGTNQWIEE